jgi:RNA polymerase sigma factor (TIGR02999 family)
MRSTQEVTQLLLAWRDGDREAFDKLVTIVYDELRRLAHRYVAKGLAGQTLQTTALVNEAYLRLAGQDQVDWQNRAHFFAVAAQVMRSLLVDRARARQAARRGAGAHQVPLDEATAISPQPDLDLLALNEALEKLAAFDQRKSQIIELRYFGGLSVEETAEVLALSPITIKREWLKAKAWLRSELTNAMMSNE